MRFSVIMPVYKTDNCVIERAIESIRKQTEKDWELIIVDDNHFDSSYKQELKILQEKYSEEQNIFFIYHSDNFGANKARNTAIRKSVGDYLAFCDADDEWDDDYLSVINEKIIESKAGIISCGYRIIQECRVKEVKNENCSDGNVFRKMIFNDLVGPTSAVVINRKATIELGGFDEKLPARQDYDMWLRLSKKEMVAYVKRVKLSIYRDGHESISTRGMNHVNGTLMVLEKLLQEESLKDYYDEICHSHYKEIALYSLGFKNYDVAKKYALLSLRKKHTVIGILILLASYLPVLFEFSRKIYRKLQ